MNLNSKIAADTFAVVQSPYTIVRLMNDARWPWLILLPAMSNVSEIHQLTRMERERFFADINTMSDCLQSMTGCTSINVAMLGNVVSDLHCHVVARNINDPNWPNPIWGFESAVGYTEKTMPHELLSSIKRRFTEQ